MVPAFITPLNLGVSIAPQVLAPLTSEPSSKSGPFFLAYPGIPVKKLDKIWDQFAVSVGVGC